MALKPWYNAIFPREDLREGKPLDASEFAVHLDQVRDGRANPDYQDPARFFSKTYLTKNLLAVAAEAVRRLSGIKTETSAVFNMTTQFGGGKTHALTLLYHLARAGKDAKGWTGVSSILERAGVAELAKAEIGVFVGTEFDSITGRGGQDGTPLRKTPWGELAWQIGGKEGFQAVAEHEKKLIAPAGEVIRSFLPKEKPCLILMDELMNYVSRNRKSGLATQLYNFLQNLSEEVRGQERVVLVVSIPASELEMNAEDQADYDRFKKVLDRLGKAVIMSAETETAEIIRRRLFEWDGITKDADKTITAFAEWAVDHRTQIPGWFPVDNAREAFRSSYPFHPVLLSVFERKWQQLPRFQQTRGILRLLALWVSKAYHDGFKGAHKDPLIGLGTAPLDDPFFRTAVFEQLGEAKLEGAVTTDICGKRESHADKLDREAVEDIRKARLHRKVATAVFFESNGGQMRAEATVPEIQLAVGEPDLDIGHIQTVMETLIQSCYYLSAERNRYRFSTTENLIKRFSDRRASISDKAIDERARAEIQKVFAPHEGIERIFFPDKSNAIPDRPALVLSVLAPEHSIDEESATLAHAKTMTWECGKSGRTFKSAIIWSIPESAQILRDEARKALAWEAIEAEKDELHIEESQKRQLGEYVGRSKRDLKEAVWRSYKFLLLLGKDNELKKTDLGLVNSSQGGSLIEVILKRLRDDGDIEKTPSPNYLVRKWPGFKEWSTKAVRDAFFASPEFPRLLNAEAVKETIARGVSERILAYAGKRPDGRYEPFVFERELTPAEVEISDDVFILTAEEAKRHVEPPKLTTLSITPQDAQVKPEAHVAFQARGADQHGRPIALPHVAWTAKGGVIDDKGGFTAGKQEGSFLIEAAAESISAQATVAITKDESRPPPQPPPKREAKTLRWTGQIPPQKWMNFYTKVLAKFANTSDLKLNVSFEVTPDGGLSTSRIEETKATLRELGLDDDVQSDT
ncbi:MAG: AAA family ATPase [Planctomycetota bacterium]|nr:MAG: AAA family ATPase [Planctomycetota bacterium]